MTQINPLSGALAQSTQVQFQQSTDKTKQARKAQEMAKNVATRDDEMEHQVENSEELTPIHEEDRRSDKRRKQHQHKPEEEETEEPLPSRLDLKA